jgi:hypothetical protein
MSKFHSKITAATIIASVIAALSTFPILTYAQQQTNFAASLSGKNMVPPTNSTATGIATFSVNPNETLSYVVNAMNINKVIGVPVTLKNGTDLVELLNLYATTGGGNKQQSAIPTGQINGLLTSGVIVVTPLVNPLNGPLSGKSVTDLVNLIKSGSAYVTIRTTPNQHGEIRGQILPSSAANITAAAPTTPAAPAMNKTAGMAAPTTPAASAVQRGCVGNAVTAWTLNSTTTHKELIDKIAGCFNQK